MSFQKSKLVYQSKYEYDDYELNEHHSFIEYHVDLSHFCQYVSKIEQENLVLDNAFYRCRVNLRISVKQVKVRESVYNSLIIKK